MSTLNYTTKVPVAKTVDEITKKLVTTGARRTMFDWDSTGNPIAISFALEVEGRTFTYRLEAPHKGVLRLITKGKSVTEAKKAQARRVAWRTVRMWVFAQVAMVEAQIAAIDEIMFPYLLGGDQKTAYRAWKESLPMLESGE